MIVKEQRKYSSFYKFPLVVTYALFFLVQFFFNFDIANHTNYGNFLSSSVSTSKHQSSVKADVQKNKQTNIRLNKRFQPANALPFKPFVLEVIVCYVQTEHLLNYQNPKLPQSGLITRRLRGPPVVA